MVLAGWEVYGAVYGPGWMGGVWGCLWSWLDGRCMGLSMVLAGWEVYGAVYGPGWMGGVWGCLWSWLDGGCMGLSMVLAGWGVYGAVYGPGWMGRSRIRYSIKKFVLIRDSISEISP